jgi:hypothetical protein
MVRFATDFVLDLVPEGFRSTEKDVTVVCDLRPVQKSTHLSCRDNIK